MASFLSTDGTTDFNDEFRQHNTNEASKSVILEGADTYSIETDLVLRLARRMYIHSICRILEARVSNSFV